MIYRYRVSTKEKDAKSYELQFWYLIKDIEENTRIDLGIEDIKATLNGDILRVTFELRTEDKNLYATLREKEVHITLYRMALEYFNRFGNPTVFDLGVYDRLEFFPDYESDKKEVLNRLENFEYKYLTK